MSKIVEKYWYSGYHDTAGKEKEKESGGVWLQFQNVLLDNLTESPFKYCPYNNPTSSDATMYRYRLMSVSIS